MRGSGGKRIKQEQARQDKRSKKMSDEAMKKVSKSFPELSRSRARSLARHLARDEGGAVAVMFVLCLGALVGMMALAIDLGKAWNVSTELQHAADACALAGATQLDGGANARIRAIRAATQGFVRNRQTFASDAVDADNDTFSDGPEVRFDTNEVLNADNITENTDIRFFKTLDDLAEGTVLTVAATDVDAHYIECTVQPRTVPFSFAAVVGAVDSASPTARAMAFNGAAYCQIPPLFTCAPEDDLGDLVFPAEVDIGKGLWMKGGQAGGLFPGNFGLLCLTDENGDTTCKAQDISDALARVNPLNLCFARDAELETKTGEVTGPVKTGLNMRFGIYPNGVHKVPDGEPKVELNPQYASTRNPVKGLTKKGGQCRETNWKAPNKNNQFPGPLQDLAPVDQDSHRNDINAMTFPRDDCAYQTLHSTPSGDVTLGNGTCRPGANGTDERIGRIGNSGHWDIETYMAINHAGYPGGWVDLYDLGAGPLSCSRCDSGVGPQYPRRFEVFEWERDSVLTAAPPGPDQPEDLAVSPDIVTETVDPDTGVVTETITVWEDLVGDPPNCGVPAASTVERRLIPIAVVDCRGEPTGKSFVIMEQVMIILLTEAVGFGPEGQGDNKNIYGEITGFTNIGLLNSIERNVIVLTE